MTHMTKLTGHSKGKPQRGMYSHKYLHLKKVNNITALITEELERKEQIKPTESRGKEVTKMGREISK